MSVVAIVVLLVTGFLNVYGQRYDQCSELRKCEQELEKNNLSHRLNSYECKELVKNINCVLKSISCVREEERQNYGSKIQRAKSRYETSCDSDGWNKRTCYNSNEITRCEENFPRRAVVYNRENCMKFDQFQSCANNAVSRSCRGEDSDYLQMYMLDMAQQLAWQCPQYSSTYSPGSGSGPGSGSPPWNTGRGSGGFNEEICCRNERCDKNKQMQCREDLRNIFSTRDIYPQDQKTQCGSYLNKFNCYLWHNYHCVEKYEKDTDVLRNGKDSIERKCDARGDIQRSDCYTREEIRQCERRLDDRTRSREISCREYKVFYDCVERYVRRYCQEKDELLFGYYMYSKVSEKAWSCSSSDSDSGYTDPYNGYTNQPYDDDASCEAMARQNYRHCDERMEKLEDEAKNTLNSRDRHVKSCCSALTFRECVRDVVKKHCRREMSSVVEALMGSSIRYRIQTCDDVNYSICSGTRILSNIMFMFAAFIASSIYFK